VASGTDPIIAEFERSCLTPEKAGVTSTSDDMARGWTSVGKDAHSGLQAYTDLVFTMLEDKIGHRSHFKKTVNGRDYYLIRYSYDGLYGLTAYNCLVSDFERDSWQFPNGLSGWLSGKVKINPLSSSELKGRKAVGNWVTEDALKPVSKIQLNVLPKDGLDAKSGGFYGTMLQSIRMEDTKTTEQET